jgi:predicted O-methyltransferase YrrM
MSEGDFLALLKEMQEYCMKNGIRAISSKCGRLLKLLVQVYSQNKRFVNVVEIGTGVGYSTLWMIKGLLDSRSKGKVCTIDPNPERTEKANYFFDKASTIKGFEEIPDLIEVNCGDALKLIPKFTFEVDFVFIDGAKNEYVQYLKALERVLKPGSVVTAHNVISHKSRLTDLLNEINNVQKRETLVIPIDTAGLSVSVWKALYSRGGTYDYEGKNKIFG